MTTILGTMPGRPAGHHWHRAVAEQISERDWQILEIGSSGTNPIRADFAMAHRDLGVALIDVGHAGLDAETELRTRLDAVGFFRIYPGYLPIVHRVLGVEDLWRIPLTLEPAFRSKPPIDISDADWVPLLQRALLLEPATPLPRATVAEAAGADDLSMEVPAKAETSPLPGEIRSIPELDLATTPSLDLPLAPAALAPSRGDTVGPAEAVTPEALRRRARSSAWLLLAATILAALGLAHHLDWPVGLLPMRSDNELGLRAQSSDAWSATRSSDETAPFPVETQVSPDIPQAPSEPPLLAEDPPVQELQPGLPTLPPPTAPSAAEAPAVQREPEMASLLDPADAPRTEPLEWPARQQIEPEPASDIPVPLELRSDAIEALAAAGDEALVAPPIEADRVSAGAPEIRVIAVPPQEAAVLPQGLIDLLIARGDEMLAQGDISGARLLYARAAAAGSAAASRAMARSFDPDELNRLGVRGIRPDASLARFWRERAEQAQ